MTIVTLKKRLKKLVNKQCAQRHFTKNILWPLKISHKFFDWFFGEFPLKNIKIRSYFWLKIAFHGGHKWRWPQVDRPLAKPTKWGPCSKKSISVPLFFSVFGFGKSANNWGEDESNYPMALIKILMVLPRQLFLRFLVVASSCFKLKQTREDHVKCAVARKMWRAGRDGSFASADGQEQLTSQNLFWKLFRRKDLVGVTQPF